MVQDLARLLTKGLTNEDEKIPVCWRWVAEKVQYPFNRYGQPTDRAEINLMEGKYCDTNAWDWWDFPNEVIRAKWSNCEGCGALIASLLRTFLPSERVWWCLGYVMIEGQRYGHGWAQVIRKDGKEYILEGTLDELPPQPWKTTEELPQYYAEVKVNDQLIEEMGSERLEYRKSHREKDKMEKFQALQRLWNWKVKPISQLKRMKAIKVRRLIGKVLRR